MLSADLVERIAQRLEEVVVGVKNLATDGELDHGLHLVDRRDHPLVHPVGRHVPPLENVADVLAAPIEAAVDQQRELEIADVDLGANRQLRRV
jgi:hypothetical protein